MQLRRTQPDSQQIRLGKYLLEQMRLGRESVPVEEVMSHLNIPTEKQLETLTGRHYVGLLARRNKELVLNTSQCTLEEFEEQVGFLENEARGARIEGLKDAPLGLRTVSFGRGER